MPNRALHILIIAHPDDESMFFVPTLRGLKACDETVWILCLTTGDYDGLGEIRSNELRQASRSLGVDKTLVCDTLNDHPTDRWDIVQVKRQIQETLRNAIDPKDAWSQLVLLTFDQHGVSGHVNHIDTFHGVCSLVSQGGLTLSKKDKKNSITIPTEAWILMSERNILAKYIPLVPWMLVILSVFLTIPTIQRNSKHRTYRLHEPNWNWKAMATHRSQFVWYRRLFVVFSCYTYVNTLERFRPLATKDE